MKREWGGIVKIFTYYLLTTKSNCYFINAVVIVRDWYYNTIMKLGFFSPAAVTVLTI